MIEVVVRLDAHGDLSRVGERGVGDGAFPLDLLRRRRGTLTAPTPPGLAFKQRRHGAHDRRTARDVVILVSLVSLPLSLSLLLCLSLSFRKSLFCASRVTQTLQTQRRQPASPLAGLPTACSPPHQLSLTPPPAHKHSFSLRPRTPEAQGSREEEPRQAPPARGRPAEVDLVPVPVAVAGRHGHVRPAGGPQAAAGRAWERARGRDREEAQAPARPGCGLDVQDGASPPRLARTRRARTLRCDSLFV